MGKEEREWMDLVHKQKTEKKGELAVLIYEHLPSQDAR